tara:strand:- start:10586 stop:10837 length:252 start_codon:yes stop_codon:yes gene_type:complete
MNKPELTKLLNSAKKLSPDGQITIATFDSSWRREVICLTNKTEEAATVYCRYFWEGHDRRGSAIEACVNSKRVAITHASDIGF